MLRFYFLRAGLPTGLLLGVAFAFRGDSTAWLDFVVTIGISAVAMTVLLAVPAEIYIRFVRRRPITVGILVGLVLLLTIVCGFTVMLAVARVPHGRWQRLPTPPGPVASFAGPTCHTLAGQDNSGVLVRGEGGGYYLYHTRVGTPGYWSVESVVPESITQGSETCRSMARSNATPGFKGDVIQRFRIDDDGVDCGGRRHYVLASDNSIWTWSTGGCALLFMVGLFAYFVALVTMGFVTGFSRLSEAAPNPWLAT